MAYEDSQLDPKERFDLALALHDGSDRWLAGQLNAYLVAQTFLVGAFAVLAATSVGEWRIILLAVFVCFSGFVLSKVLSKAIASNWKRSRFMKRDYLLLSDMYQNLITADHSRERMSLKQRQDEFDSYAKKNRHPFVQLLPSLIEAFWVIAGAIELTFFLTFGAMAK